MIYDGDCPLCRSLINLIEKRNTNDRLCPVSYQSARGREVMDKAGIGIKRAESSVLLKIDGINRLYNKSMALIKIAGLLGGLWSWTRIFIILPRPLRDRIYDMFARKRYRLTGRKQNS